MLDMTLDTDIKELKKELDSKGITNIPYPQEDIEKAIHHFNGLPKKLTEYYQLIGSVELDEPKINIYSPNELIENNNIEDEFIDIAFDYYGMFGLAIKQTDLKDNNPIIYLSGEVAIMALEDDELEEKLNAENLLFEIGDDVYISCLTKDMSNELLPELSDDINVLKDLVTSLNFFTKYYSKIETEF
jgi:hypothetical protein